MPLPDLLDATWTYNSAPYACPVVTLEDGTQYAIWIRSGDLHRIFGKRNAITDATWTTTVDLDLLPGSPLGTQLPDGHNTYSIGVDLARDVHVIGNQHASPKRYIKTSTPGDITTFASAAMVGTNESAMTYGYFFNTADGTLFITYRDGVSGNANVVFNRWDGSAWVRVGIPITGVEDSESAYIQNIMVNPTVPQGWQVMWTWRQTSQASSNHDNCFVETLDGGATWKRSDGSAQALPITVANAEVVHEIPTLSGIMNQSGGDCDENGDPHTVWLLQVGAFSQYMHVYRTPDNAWHTEIITTFDQLVQTVGVTIVDLYVARPAVYCYKGRVLVIGRCRGTKYGNGVLLIDATPGHDHTPVKVFDDDLHEWDPATDLRGLRERGEINLLVVDTQSPAAAGTFNAEPAGILTLKLNNLGTLLGLGTRLGKAQMDAIKPPDVAVATYNRKETVTTSGSGKVVLALGAVPQSASVYVNGVLLWPGEDYTISGSLISILASVGSGVKVRVDWWSPVPAPAAMVIRAWAPDVMTDQILWLNAADLTAADGTGVQLWANRWNEVGVGQNTTAARPALATVNGLRTVVFDGVDDVMQTNTMNSAHPSPNLVAMLVKVTGSTALERQLFSGNPGIFVAQTTGGWKISAGTNLGGGRTANDGAWHVVVARINGDATSEIRLDGTLLATGNAGSGALSTLRLMKASTAVFTAGSIHEVVVVGHNPSTSELESLEAYLGAKRATLIA